MVKGNTMADRRRSVDKRNIKRRKMMSKDSKVIITPDRVTFSESRKINLGNYESQDVFVSYSTDVAKGEKPEKALLRTSIVVTDILKKRVKKIIGKNK